MAGHRYWMIGNLFSYHGYVSAGELWLQAGGVDLGPPVANAVSSALDGGSVGSLAYDGTPASRWMTNGGQDGTSAIAYDYGADVLPDGVRLQAPSGDPPERTAVNGAVFFSDTGLSGPWTPYASLFFTPGWGYGDQQIRALATPPADVGGHRFWRLGNITSYAGDYINIAEMWFQIGGVDTQAPAVSSSPDAYNGFLTSVRAYDGDAATFWMLPPGNQGTGYLAYDFGGPIAIDGIRVKATTGDIASRAPHTATIQFSDNGVDWGDGDTLTFAPWSDGDVQTFSSGPPVPSVKVAAQSGFAVLTPVPAVAVAAQSAFAVMGQDGINIAAQSAFAAMTQKGINIAAQSAFVVFLPTPIPPPPPTPRRRQYYLQ